VKSIGLTLPRHLVPHIVLWLASSKLKILNLLK